MTETRINELFEELVPMMGKADTVAGEIIRAISRIAYRNWNDGDHIGVGYGNETCNAPARFLAASCNKKVLIIVIKMWGITEDDAYDDYLRQLEEAVLEFIDMNPELKTKKNEDDMWNHQADEDFEYEEDEC